MGQLDLLQSWVINCSHLNQLLPNGKTINISQANRLFRLSGIEHYKDRLWYGDKASHHSCLSETNNQRLLTASGLIGGREWIKTQNMWHLKNCFSWVNTSKEINCCSTNPPLPSQAVLDFFQDFPQPHSSKLPLFVALNASSHETPFERNLNFGCHSLKSSVKNCILHATVPFVGWPGHVMICVDCFWQLSEQAIRLSRDWVGHDHDLSNRPSFLAFTFSPLVPRISLTEKSLQFTLLHAAHTRT